MSSRQDTFGSIFTVARREYVERVRDKGFWIGILVIVAFLALSILLPQFFFGDEDTFTIGVAGEQAAPLAEALPAAGDAVGRQVQVETFPDTAAAEAAVADEDIDAAVTDGTLLAGSDPPQGLVALVQSVAGRLSAQQTLQEAGVSPATAQQALNPTPLTVRTVQVETDTNAVAANTARVGVGVLYFLLFIYGMGVAQGVVEEKSSRVVEILLATVRPVHLLAGKVIGLGLVGLTQLVLFAVLGVVGAVATGLIDVPGEAVGPAVLAVAWFIPGYALFASLFAMAGAVVSRQEELQNSTQVANMAIVVSFLLALYAGFDPDGTPALLLSFLPTAAPLLMPVRMAAGAAAWWEVALSVTLLIAAAAGVVLLAARVYARGVLQVRGRIRLTQALRGSA